VKEADVIAGNVLKDQRNRLNVKDITKPKA
jgi:hypothetical protein